MKKVLSLVLVLTLVLGSFGFAFATTPKTTLNVASDVEGTVYEDAVTVLTALKVVSGYEDGTYKPANIVTRAEMAKLIIAELGLEANATGSKSTFKDMAGYGWAEGFVGYAQSLGIINGYGDGTFKPGKTVSYDEAITMMVAALGYTKACKEMNGSWPAIYVQKARVLGLTDDVKAGGAVGANRGDIAIMLYNMLTADMGYADSDGVFQNKKDKDGKDIKVATNLDVEEAEDYKIIDQADAEDALVNIREYIGAYAKVFTVTKGDDEDCIIAISDVKSKFITGTWDGTDILEAADGTEYKLANSKMADDGDKNVDDNYTEFENGVDKTINFMTADKIYSAVEDRYYTLAVDLSGKTVDTVYSASQWIASAEAQIDEDDIKTIKDNQKLLGKEFTLDGNDEIDLNSFELVGVNSLGDIKEDNIIYVYVGGADNEITKVAVGAETVSGEVTKRNSDGDELTIDGKKYAMSSVKLADNGVAGELTANEIDTEDEVKLFLDAFGFAYDYESISGKADNFAVALEVGDGSTSIGADKEIKLFLNDGTDKVFTVDSDAMEDAVTGLVDADDTWNDDFLAKNKAGMIVKYGVDKNGVVDTFEDVAAGDYDFVAAGATAHKVTEKGYFDGYVIKSNAVIYAADFAYNIAQNSADRRDEDNYSVTTLEKVLDSDDVHADYVLDDGKIVAMLIYDYSISDDVYGVVTDKAKNKSDAGYEIEFYIDGKTVTYNAKSTPYGDVSTAADAVAGQKLWKLTFDSNGAVKSVTDAIGDGDTYAQIKISVTSDAAVTYSGRVVTLADSTKVTSSDAVRASFSTNGDRITLDSKVAIYTEDDGDWTIGSTSDLKALDGKTAVFYDIDGDEDRVMDVVLIY
ncbi:S-layer homology domain-containing protein [Anaerovorax sp. IOR16]|uniref:S-layer homology domain-containing protein n=1 Tax=Anaerovorax sp. IOR16 TaxID=2773458 RepID=UPI0019D01705|nr:S-layer homology domain-containing protein [Anaerovorax sp. IOR16]